MTPAILSLIIAFAGYSLLNISQAAQKIGLARFAHHRIPGAAIWIAATLGTTAAAFILLYAVSIGSVALVGAMAGSGLASLALFSRWVMREPISCQEGAGIAVIFAAAVLIGAFSRELPPVRPKPSIVFIYGAIICALYILLWIIFARRRAVVGIVIAGFSGALGGVVPLFQKLSTSDYGRARALLELEFQAAGRFHQAVRRGAEALSNPYALLWMLITVLSMVIMQFSFRRDTAIRLIPSFSASYIAVPVIGALICLEERLHPLQWAGIGAIAAGVLLLTVKKRRAG